MNLPIFLISIIIIVCLVGEKLSKKIGLPSLLVFLLLGMVFGVDGLFKINFNEYKITDEICSFLLLFIMFNGGIGTNIQIPKKAIVQATLLSTIGVAITMVVLALSVHLIFKIDLRFAFLLSAALSSTDAATVFYLLKNSKLSLKNNTSNILAIESGSNDPFAYLFTIVFISLINSSQISIPLLLISQIIIGLFFGFVFAHAAIFLLNKFDFTENTADTILLFSLSILCYALTKQLNGNQYLAVYLFGIILGNSFIPRKYENIQFFNNINNMSQMTIFFLLGLLVTPHLLHHSFIYALLIFILISFFARPIAVYLIMKPFKAKLNQIALISFAGLRGASSIVFAIVALCSVENELMELFNVIFIIVLLSIIIQGGLLPNVAKSLNMIDNKVDVRKTFNDYADDNEISFIKLHLSKDHSWTGKCIKDIKLPDCLITMIIRNNENIKPEGSTELKPNDIIILAGTQFISKENLSFSEVYINSTHPYLNSLIKNIHLDEKNIIVMIKRNKDIIIPNGSTQIILGDNLVMCKF